MTPPTLAERIAALREPSEAMVEAGCDPVQFPPPLGGYDATADAVWRAMLLDAAPRE